MAAIAANRAALALKRAQGDLEFIAANKKLCDLVRKRIPESELDDSIFR